MGPTVAVAHYPEGAGHATRMLGIAEALESAGADVRMAGGGAGSAFVALNGYDAFEPTNVDFVDSYQEGSLLDVVGRSLPASLGRIADYRAWLDAVDPDALVTDDMFAAMAADRTDVPLYVLKHDVPGLYRDPVERTGARFHTRFQLAAAEDFFYPVVWPGSRADPTEATRIPPVALPGNLEGEPGTGEADLPEREPDVVVVPSHYSDLSRLATHLRRQGYDVLDVADDDWDPVPSLLPYVAAADVVVCSGYSTIMDAAVAGTPCVVRPATDEQEAVADWLDRFDVTGFAVAESGLDALDAVTDPPDPPEFENGADVVAESVLRDLRDPDPYAAASDSEDADPSVAAADAAVSRASRLTTLAAVPTLAAALATAGVAGPTRLPAMAAERGRRGAAAARALAAMAGDATRAGAASARTALADAGDRLRSAVRTLGRRSHRLGGRVLPQRRR